MKEITIQIPRAGYKWKHSYEETLLEWEKEFLQVAYRHHKGNVVAMSKGIGLNRNTVRAKLIRAGIIHGKPFYKDKKNV